MINTKVYGFQGEGRTLCQSCAERIYGDSFEMYMNSGDIQILSEKERPFYASKGLLCDDCFNWILQPEKIGDLWWLVELDPEENFRLLAPFADFLVTLRIDATNLRNLSDV